MSRGPSPFRVVILTGWDSPSTREAIMSVVGVPGVKVAAVIYDRGVYPFKTRVRRLWKRSRREGWTYLAGRVLDAARGASQRLLPRALDTISPLRRVIFPGEVRSLIELCERHGISYFSVDSLNGPEAQTHLTGLEADLGIVIGTRILKRQTFALPRLGSINVHKGKVPEYRGQPPAFWELYNGAAEAGVTIHLVDEKLDAGHVVREGTIAISVPETEHSLRLRLDELAARLLAEAVELMATGRASLRPQPPVTGRPYTTPTGAQRAALDRRLGTLPESRLKQWLKAAFYRVCLAGGPVWVRNGWLRLRRRTRCTVLLYHRVNDTSKDKLTTSVDRFIEHLAMLKRMYPVLSLSAACEALEIGRYLGPNVVAITFDDGYDDNYTCAAPVLEHFGLPGTFFVTAGLVDTAQPFPHDAGSPYRFSTLSWAQVKDLAGRGFEIGSHGWSHANLGQCSPDEAHREIIDSRDMLQGKLGVRIRSFAYPFGGRDQVTATVIRQIEDAGFDRIASAYGGVNVNPLDCRNVVRIGVGEVSDTWALRAKIEGIDLQAIHESWPGRGVLAAGSAGLGTQPLSTSRRRPS